MNADEAEQGIAKNRNFLKHKVPPAYSRADENTRSLYGRRDDEDL